MKETLRGMYDMNMNTSQFHLGLCYTFVVSGSQIEHTKTILASTNERAENKPEP